MSLKIAADGGGGGRECDRIAEGARPIQTSNRNVKLF